mgnify:CR=1 FL=1
MRINFNAIQPKNTIINAARVNASFAKNNSRTGKILPEPGAVTGPISRPRES